MPYLEVTRFLWIIAWVWETLIGRNFPHALHHSYLNEAIEQQEDHHLHLPFSHDVHLLSYTWRKSLEDRFIAYHFQPWWRLLKEEATRRRRGDFVLPLQFLEDKQRLGGGDCNVPKLALANWNINFSFFVFAFHD